MITRETTFYDTTLVQNTKLSFLYPFPCELQVTLHVHVFQRSHQIISYKYCQQCHCEEAKLEMLLRIQ